MMRRALIVVVAAVIGLPPRGVSSKKAATTLSEYEGNYRSGSHTIYLQRWSELTGTDHLTAFEDSGEARTLYPLDRDQFFAGPAIADSTRRESTINFRRDSAGRIASLIWE